MYNQKQIVKKDLNLRGVRNPRIHFPLGIVNTVCALLKKIHRAYIWLYKVLYRKFVQEAPLYSQLDIEVC